jgi:hypothetical protein
VTGFAAGPVRSSITGNASRYAEREQIGVVEQLPKRKKSKVVPRLGPPKNLRKAGAHEDQRRKALDRFKDEEQQELDDLKAIGSWAYDEDSDV